MHEIAFLRFTNAIFHSKCNGNSREIFPSIGIKINVRDKSVSVCRPRSASIVTAKSRPTSAFKGSDPGQELLYLYYKHLKLNKERQHEDEKVSLTSILNNFSIDIFEQSCLGCNDCNKLTWWALYDTLPIVPRLMTFSIHFKKVQTYLAWQSHHMHVTTQWGMASSLWQYVSHGLGKGEWWLL